MKQTSFDDLGWRIFDGQEEKADWQRR